MAKSLFSQLFGDRNEEKGPPPPVKFEPCRKGAHAHCTTAYFDKEGQRVRCSCSCHPDPSRPLLFDVRPNARPSTERPIIESVQPDLFSPK
jgi:hypothetical protein